MEAPRQQKMEHKNADTKLDWERGGGDPRLLMGYKFV